jgi:NAD-dependent DNA ligase
LDGQIIVFSGFRDKDLEGMITTNGGIIGSAVSKNTTLVIAKDVNETSSKLNKARDYKIPIQNRDFFVKNNFI